MEVVSGDDWSHETCNSSQIVTTNKPTPSFIQAGIPISQCQSRKKEKVSRFMDLLTSSSPGGLPSLSRTLKAPRYLGAGCQVGPPTPLPTISLTVFS